MSAKYQRLESTASFLLNDSFTYSYVSLLDWSGAYKLVLYLQAAISLSLHSLSHQTMLSEAVKAQIFEANGLEASCAPASQRGELWKKESKFGNEPNASITQIDLKYALEAAHGTSMEVLSDDDLCEIHELFLAVIAPMMD